MDKTFTACTSDKKSASLHLIIDDNASKKIIAEIGKAFTDAAKQLTADDLRTGEGFSAFTSELSQEDVDAITSLTGPPEIVGDCK